VFEEKSRKTKGMKFFNDERSTGRRLTVKKCFLRLERSEPAWHVATFVNVFFCFVPTSRIGGNPP